MSYGNMSEFDESASDVIPKGDYQVCMFSWEEKKPAKGGIGINIQFVVTSGEYENRRIFSYYNVQHSNADAVRIAMQQLKSFFIACGLNGNQDLNGDVLDSAVGIPVTAKVGIQVDKTGQYGDSNKITKFTSAGSQRAPVAAPPPAPAAPPASPAPAAPASPPPAAPASPPPSAPPVAPATTPVAPPASPPPAAPATPPPAPPVVPAANPPPWEA